MAQLRGNVTAPPPRPPKYGLIIAAPIIEDPDPRNWVAGWTFEAEGCGEGGIGSIACEGNTAAMVPDRGGERIEGDPLWLWAGDTCSTIGRDARDWEGRARRALAATESFRLAAELWDGAVAQADGLVNPWLAGPGADSDTVTDGATAEVPALGCVEAALASDLHGQQGMVHMTPQVLLALAAARGGQGVRKDGNVWTTPMGHIVVADAGYSGAGPNGVPAGDSQWIYGTPVLSVRLSPVELIPGSLADARNLAAATDRGVNDITVIAGRMAGVQWPSECAHIAAEIDVPICLTGGAS